MVRKGLMPGELKGKRAYEQIPVNEYKKMGAVVEKERLVCGFFGGKVGPMPHDLFNKSSDVVALYLDGTHLIAVTSGELINVKTREDFFDEHIPDYPGIICEVWYFAENSNYVLRRRKAIGVWYETTLNAGMPNAKS